MPRWPLTPRSPNPTAGRFRTCCAARALGQRSCRPLDLSQPGVSKHLKVLRERVVEVRHEGRQRWYGLRAQPLAEVDQWLRPYREYWSGRLDALELHLEENPE